MKFLAIVAAVVTVCASSAIPPAAFKTDIDIEYEAIPTIPGDNSHYVEGKSRYIWMSDRDGVPQLIDLHDPVDESALKSRSGEFNHYWLFTRQNPTNPQVLVSGIPHILRETNYVHTRPLIFIIHGFMSSASSEMNTMITSALLAVHDANVVVVDWSLVANDVNYNTAAAAVPAVGRAIGTFLVWLLGASGTLWANVHLVGHGMGAHIAGRAGQQAGRHPNRITGLDPAGPGFKNNANALSSSDGVYVEGIHTDGDLLGIFDRVGNTDFYPNGGRHPQPECWFSSCSHDRAWELYAASVRNNAFLGRRCTTVNQILTNTCTGTTLRMGNAAVAKTGTAGMYRLTTRGVWPF